MSQIFETIGLLIVVWVVCDRIDFYITVLKHKGK